MRCRCTLYFNDHLIFGLTKGRKDKNQITKNKERIRLKTMLCIKYV